MKWKFLWVILFFSFVMSAQDDVYLLGKVLVIADPIVEKEYDKATSKDFILYNREDVASAAALIPGVTLTSMGARNEHTINVRGLDLRQVPLFIDGIPVYLPYDGYVDLGRFFWDDISEIQVTKGYTSILTGPNALGGVINLVGQRPARSFQGKVQLGVSGDNEGDCAGSKLNASLGGLKNKFYYNVSGQFQKKEHIRDADKQKISHTQTKDHKINAKVAFTPNTGSEYSINYINQKGTKEIPTYAGDVSSVQKRYWRYPEWDKQSLYWISQTKLNQSSYLKTRLFYDQLENTLESYDDATYTTMNNAYAFTSYYDDNVIGGNAELGKYFEDLTLKGAFHFKRDNHREHNEGNPIQHFADETYSLGIESAYQFKANSKVVGGVSYNWREDVKAEDYNSTTEVMSNYDSNKNEALNAQVNYLLKLNEQNHLNASIAYRTRFPTMKDRYSYKQGKALPNPDLDEEVAINYEIDWDLKLPQIFLGVKMFYYDIDQTIQSVNISTTKTQMQNTGKSYVDGFELEAKKELNPVVLLQGNYTYTHKKNRSNSTLHFTNSPEHTASVSSVFSLFQKWKLIPNLEFSSSRYSDTSGLQKVKKFALAHLYCQYNVKESISLNLEIRNILNKQYELSEGYPEAGRLVFLSSSISF